MRYFKEMQGQVVFDLDIKKKEGKRGDEG